MVINYLLNGMILQVGWPANWANTFHSRIASGNANISSNSAWPRGGLGGNEEKYLPSSKLT